MKDESRPALEISGPNGTHAATALRSLPTNIAVKCPGCRELLVGKDWEKSLRVCPKCGHHFRLSASDRIRLLADERSFREFAVELRSSDPLGFVSRSQSYAAKLETEYENSGLNDSVVAGRCEIEHQPVILVVMDFRFIGGSMGAVAGEKITRAAEYAASERVPLVMLTASGGARMYEGAIALMQMAKTSAALARLAQAGVPHISVLTDPTTGGVTASFAMLGDVIIAEPGAVVGFTGPRVIEQFMHQRLPKGTASSEFVLQHGMIDAIVHRRELRPTLAKLVRLYSQAGTNQ